ncbi:hypothetical protein MKQ68_05165 [Chitinophaga horti]|uniref:Protease n=1 Tax=Chitinophaga horti TaxID=2920382 RepID=A0ABY6J8K2_9BACT|nr:hypothetical protein [Chitinophaga horti]UYQ94479.1 hypothetical protein MKQ68_05165 [Chitinophaga horti]
MKRYGIMPAIALFSLAFTACKSTQQGGAPKGKLVTTMSVAPQIGAEKPVMLHFVVYNPTKTELQFCKWHTPFEGFMSSFLDVKTAGGQPVDYRGAMAKRIMPPPAEAYIKVPARDSVSVDIDLSKGYNLAAPGLYSATYQASGMSGLEKVNDITFTITR